MNIQKYLDTLKKLWAPVNASEIRMAIHDALETMGNNVLDNIDRQTDVEEQFQDVIENTTGKDVISAPEIIAARNGEANLKTRIDKDYQEVTAQLAQKATKSNLAIEKSRIDSLSTLTEGSTTGDAELADGRIGEDGITYKNLGGAIRNQFKKTNTSINNLGTFSENMLLNPDFDTTEHWTSISDTYGVLTTVENELIYEVKSLIASARIEQTETVPIVGHKYYVSGEIYPRYGIRSHIQIGSDNVARDTLANEWNKINGIVTPTDTSPFRFFHPTNERYTVGLKVGFRRMLCIDLTETFGKGFEPDVKTMESFLSNYTGGWFEKNGFMKPTDTFVKSVSEEVMGKKTIVILNADGTGDYPTLRKAFEATTLANKEHIFEIQLSEGTYNAFDGYTDVEINNTSFVGPFLNPYVHLIGMGDKSKTVIYGDLTAYNEATCGRVAPLNTTGNYELKNVTVKGKNTRYAVHDDYNYPDTETVVENCHIIRESGAKGSLPAWGEGTHSGMIRKFKNVIFETKAAHNPYATHNNINFEKPSENYFDNCQFISNGSHVDFQTKSLGSGTKDIVELKNCEFSGGIVNCIENATGDGFDYDLRIISSDEVPVQITANDGSQPVYYQSGVTKRIQNSGTAILKGDVVELRNDGAGVLRYTLSDPLRFYGIALEDIPSGEVGWVQYGGKFSKQEFPEVSSLSKYDLIGISNGRLAKVANRSDAIAFVHTGYFVKFL